MERLTVAKKYDIQWGRNNVIDTVEFRDVILSILYDVTENPYDWDNVREIEEGDWKKIIEELKKRKDDDYARCMQAYYNEADKRDGWIHFEFI